MSLKRPYRLVPVQKIGSTEAHVRLVAPNGEIVMTSERYDSLDNAKRAAATIADEGINGFRVGLVKRIP